ncbi:MAG: hypothetical protein ACREOO_00130 [bacterium]
MLATTDGGYVLVCDAYDYFSDNSWMIKTDAAGNEVWTYRFEGAALSAAEASDGGYVIAGNTRRIDDGLIDSLLLKVDRDGTKVWERKFGTAGKGWLKFVAGTNEGGFIVGGFASDVNYDYWLIKTDANGQPIWQRTFDKGEPDDEAYAVIQTFEGGYLLAGTSGNKIWLVKTNATGTKEWDKIIGD